MKKYLLLVFAVIIGFYLRIHLLATVPMGMTWDEAALGYNAFSILKTGRDEFGKFMPLIFKSFGDYKPGLYVYLTVPSVAVFGLTEQAVRVPSVIFGVLAILGLYLLTKELFIDEKKNNFIASLSALSLAISPWHVHFSRGAWEVNVFVTLLLFGMVYLLRYLRGKSSLAPAIIFACLSLLCYQAAKVLTPVTYCLILIIYWKDFLIQIKETTKSKLNSISILLGIFFSVWFLYSTLFGSAGNRLTTLSIFGYKPGISSETKQIDSGNKTTLALYHNQSALTSHLVISRYLYNFSPEVLFYEGKIFTERGRIPNLGILNPLEFIWLAFGLVYLASNFKNKNSLFITLLLLISPIPASLTLAEFSTVRSLYMVIPLAMISSLGIYHLITKINYFIIPIAAIYLLVFIYTFDIYFLHAARVTAKEFNYGYKQAMEFVNKYPNAKKVIMTDVLGQPYIYYLFYTKYNPADYQKQNNFVSGGLDVGNVPSVGKAEFHQFNTQDLNTQKDTVFIGTVGNISNDFKLDSPIIEDYATINYPYDGSNLFRMIKTRP